MFFFTFLHYFYLEISRLFLHFYNATPPHKCLQIGCDKGLADRPVSPSAKGLVDSVLQSALTKDYKMSVFRRCSARILQDYFSFLSGTPTLAKPLVERKEAKKDK